MKNYLILLFNVSFLAQTIQAMDVSTITTPVTTNRRVIAAQNLSTSLTPATYQAFLSIIAERDSQDKSTSPVASPIKGPPETTIIDDSMHSAIQEAIRAAASYSPRANQVKEWLDEHAHALSDHEADDQRKTENKSLEIGRDEEIDLAIFTDSNKKDASPCADWAQLADQPAQDTHATEPQEIDNRSNDRREEISASHDTLDALYPLHEAIRTGQREIALQLIIGQLIDLHIRDALGQTALHAASQTGDKELCETLMAAGAEVDVHDAQGITPLHIASHHGHDYLVSLMLEKVSAQKKQALLNAQTSQGWTALHYAAWHGHMESAAILIIHHAPLEISCREKNTPLHFATWRNHAHVAQLLICCNASQTARNMNNATPFHLAAFRGITPVINLMLSYNPDLTDKTKSGSTPLHCAAWRGHTEVVRLLLEARARPDILNIREQSALTLARLKDQREVITILEALVSENK